ncbi:hypothetical protein EE612_059588, partial [Oryza sativa]
PELEWNGGHSSPHLIAAGLPRRRRPPPPASPTVPLTPSRSPPPTPPRPRPLPSATVLSYLPLPRHNALRCRRRRPPHARHRDQLRRHRRRRGTRGSLPYFRPLVAVVESVCRICLCLVPGSLLFLLVGWLQVRGDGEILSQVVSSQEDLLVRWGGVAPKMAEEAHSLAIDQVVQKALDDANVSENDLSAVAVTVGPGLSLCLRVGVHKARKIAKSFRLPIVGVHHMEAHALVSR